MDLQHWWLEDIWQSNKLADIEHEQLPESLLVDKEIIDKGFEFDLPADLARISESVILSLQSEKQASTMDQEVDGIRPIASSSRTESPGYPKSDCSVAHAGEALPPFTCEWAGCFNKYFTRKSDMKKHWDRHTKPFICQESGCNGMAFGDKATLRRHETERHRKHEARSYFCPLSSCPRASKGFPRKRNRDLHVSTRHSASSIMTSEGKEVEGTFETCEHVRDESLGTQANEEDREMTSVQELNILELKLKALEREKSELDSRRNRVDEDIEALKRAIRLVAT